MWNPTPWMVDGARHSAAVGRLVAYASLNGSEGVVLPTDLKVTALGSPGAAVQVAPGGAIILNRYPGGVRETYVGLNPASHQVPIAATTSAGKLAGACTSTGFGAAAAALSSSMFSAPGKMNCAFP